MEQILLSKKLNYLDCDKQGFHTGESLNYICLDSQCKNKGLICAICRNDQHQKHQVLTFKDFLFQISKNLSSQIQDQKNYTDLDDILTKVENIHQNNQYALKQLVISVSKQIQDMEAQICENYKNIKKKLISQAQMRDNLPEVINNIINGEYNQTQQLHNDCNKIIDTITLVQNKINLDFNPDQVCTNYSKYQEKFQKTVNDINANIKKQFENPLKQLEVAQSITNETLKDSLIQLPSLKFSTSKKSQFISVEQSGKLAKQTVQNHQEKRIALLEPELSQQFKSRWAIQMTKYMSWVGLGIGFGNILQNLDYKFNYQQEGHGNLQLSSNGYTWNTNDKSQNTKLQGFKFGAGDIILCQFDPINKQLQLCKLGDSLSKYTFSNILIPQGEKVYASVNLGNAQESVSYTDWKIDYDKYFENKDDKKEASAKKIQNIFKNKQNLINKYDEEIYDDYNYY